MRNMRENMCLNVVFSISVSMSFSVVLNVHIKTYKRIVLVGGGIDKI